MSSARDMEAKCNGVFPSLKSRDDNVEVIIKKKKNDTEYVLKKKTVKKKKKKTCAVKLIFAPLFINISATSMLLL
jgi:hypothetical protein